MDKMAETSTLWLAKILQFVYKEKREEKSDTDTDSSVIWNEEGEKGEEEGGNYPR